MPQPPAIEYPPELPVSQRRGDILAALREHPVVIVAGETGSGKTTQLPKMCLEAGLARRGRIGCTQPRRVAAMSVSRRVAEELAPIGFHWGREVGCKMRFSDDTGPRTRIKFMTDGILLAEIQSDPLLRAYSTLIIDEAHERSLNIDFLLGYLQGLLARRHDLKLIITSATIDTEAFSAAFGGAPVIEVTGRLFPVEIRYRPITADEEADDPSHVDAAVRAVEEAFLEGDAGDLLVFMPTERDIRETRELLENALGPGCDVLALYGRMASADQQKIFAPGERRRVVIATNVAETSLTIPRIHTVIDTGLARISRYNPRTRTRRLPVEPISQSSANQRAGRAGRVREGVCVRLYEEEDFLKRPRFTQPEIQRSNLAEVILRMKAFRLGDVERFPFLNPPLPQAIRAGYRLLEELGALEAAAEGEGYRLTDRGRELARLPLDPTLGRMLLEARAEKCLPQLLVIAAGLSLPDPRERPEEAREAAAAAHRAFADPRSDFLSLLNLWNAAPPPEGAAVRTSRNALRRFCKANFLSLSRMREWRDIYRQLVETMDARPRPAPAPADDDATLYGAIHRAILAGSLGQVAQRKERNLYTAVGNREVTLFPGSHLYERGQPRKGEKRPRQPEWIMAAEFVQTSQHFARTVAMIDPQWIVAIGLHLCRFRHTHPEWNARAGRVLVWERVLLGGLEVARRQIDYGKIHPQEATELFIRGALVEGEARIRQRFFEANRALREEVETTLAKTRDFRVHDLDEALYRFYAARIEAVSSVHDLDRLMRERLPRDPRFLQATEADLVEAGQLACDREAFPDQVPLANAVIPVEYTFEPGSERDGVTLRLPLPLVEVLEPGAVEGAIPGLRRQQVETLLASLPRALRKALQPLEPKTDELLAALGPEETLPRGLTRLIRSRYGVAIPPEAWKPLPDHLRPRLEVIDARRRAIAAGRDLGAVRAAVEGKTPTDAWERAVRRWEKSGFLAWEFGDLPETVTLEKVAGVPLSAYPGLRRGEEGRVDLTLFRKPAQAAAATADALRQLGLNALSDAFRALDFRDVATPPARASAKTPAKASAKAAAGAPAIASLGDLLKGLEPKLAKPAPAARNAPVGTRPITAFRPPAPAATREPGLPDLSHAAMSEALAGFLFRLEPPAPLTAARYEAMLERARRELPGAAQSLRETARRIVAIRAEILAFPHPHPAREKELTRLLPPDFLRTTPYAQLIHLPRYLRALQLRQERAALHPARDAEKARPLAAFAGWEEKIAPGQRETFRWMLEEFRVSLFAQELGTPQPVSARRLETFLENSPP